MSAMQNKLHLCERTDYCLYCSAQQTARSEDGYVMDIRKTSASLRVLSESDKWTALREYSIFCFIVELGRWLFGHGLRKELSHYGAIRNNDGEVNEFVQQRALRTYYCYSNMSHDNLHARATMDPGNMIYTPWLFTISGSHRKHIWSNSCERLGDMMENALALCWNIDEFS